MFLIVKIVLLSIIINCSTVYSLKLEQVLILSRHNIRAPFIGDIVRLTPKSLPALSTEPAYLTPKGAMLEESMGEYFKGMFVSENNEGKCPDDNTVYIYANNTQRTIATANSFAKGAFKGCNVTIHVQNQDHLIFNDVIRNSSQEFKNTAITAMQQELDKYTFTSQYLLLNDILNLNQSEACKSDNICDFNQIKGLADIQYGKTPLIYGPFYNVFDVIDTFVMGYYEGLPLEKIAWGAFSDLQQMKPLIEFLQVIGSVKFDNNLIAKDIANPMLKYMADTFIDKKPKYSLLFGHDTNIQVVLAALKANHYEVRNHFEKAPIGGKLVFQKWLEEKTNKYLFRLNLVYQSADQIRNGIRASADNPPESLQLQVQGCDVDSNGFCPWEDFLNMFFQSLV